MTGPDRYRARMEKVLDHIERHLDGELDLDALSRVAAFSKYHFHRQFVAFFGISLHRYVQLARLQRASKRLAGPGGPSITEIALDAGYETPDAFARAFRQRFEQSPSGFRKSPEWEPWLRAFRPLHAARSKLMTTTFSPDQVTIREVAPTRVAIFEHRGDRRTVDATIQRFIAWRKSVGLTPQSGPLFNVWYSERDPANPDDYRMDLCVGIADDRVIDPGEDNIRIGEIPGGRCAVLRVTGDNHNLEPAALYLYRDWLPDSGEEMRDFPIYCQRFFLEPPELGTAAERGSAAVATRASKPCTPVGVRIRRTRPHSVPRSPAAPCAAACLHVGCPNSMPRCRVVRPCTRAARTWLLASGFRNVSSPTRIRLIDARSPRGRTPRSRRNTRPHRPFARPARPPRYTARPSHGLLP